MGDEDGRAQVGGRDCRLIVYPRGQSQPPNHLSMFLEVTDSRASSASAAWSCFVSHRLSVVNQKTDGTSVTKESQNRYSKTAKDWGWREFVTLTSLFDQDAGYLVNDTVVFAAEVLILKETTESRAPAEADVGKVCVLVLSVCLSSPSLRSSGPYHITSWGSEHRPSEPELNRGLFGDGSNWSRRGWTLWWRHRAWRSSRRMAVAAAARWCCV